MNKMQEIRVEKITLNIGTGAPGEKLDKATKLLQNLTGVKPVQTSTKKRIPTWGLRPGLKIGCKVTLRGEKAKSFLKRLLEAKGNQLKASSFDQGGNVSFGIPEYLDIPGAEYDMSIGIIGLEAAVTLARPGFRIARRNIQKKPIPKKAQIKKEEAMHFMTTAFGTKIGVDHDNE